MKNLMRVSELARAYNFTEAQIRWWLFQGATNGLNASGAVIRIGRSIRVDADKFEAWLDSKASR